MYLNENIDVDEDKIRANCAKHLLSKFLKKWRLPVNGRGRDPQREFAIEDSVRAVDSTSTNRNDRCDENWSNWMSSSNFREEKTLRLVPAKWWLDSDIPRKFIHTHGISRPVLKENIFLVSFAMESIEYRRRDS